MTNGAVWTASLFDLPRMLLYFTRDPQISFHAHSNHLFVGSHNVGDQVTLLNVFSGSYNLDGTYYIDGIVTNVTRTLGNRPGTYDQYLLRCSQTPTTSTSTSTTTTAPAPTVFTITSVFASGAGAYVINGTGGPTLNLTRGSTYTFNISAVGHPFWIKTTQTTGQLNAYSTGITNNGTANGTLTFTVDAGAPDILFYNCEFHIGMSGVISIT